MAGLVKARDHFAISERSFAQYGPCGRGLVVHWSSTLFSFARLGFCQFSELPLGICLSASGGPFVPGAWGDWRPGRVQWLLGPRSCGLSSSICGSFHCLSQCLLFDSAGGVSFSFWLLEFAK